MRTGLWNRRRRARLALWLLPTLLLAVCVAAAPPVHFYSDDPIAREPQSQDASGAQPIDVGLFFELSYNLFVTAYHTPSNTRAGNVNTIDEVPDSSWFTNRVGSRPLGADEVATGAATGRPPDPAQWTIIREKTEGANPGFTARDASGETWFLAFDQPGRPEGGTAAVVVASKLFWALGYNQVEMFLTTFDPGKAKIDPAATKRRPSGERTPFTVEDLREALDRVVRSADGTYRAAAGRLLPGKILGGFRYSGTRPDDPNDLVPHEHRRELRSLRVFGAWTNLTDIKAGNTVDTLVTENGHGVIRHVLQDVGSAFGMANEEHEWSIGFEHFYQTDTTRRRLLSFGFALSPWQTVPYPAYFPSVGYFEGDSFDPRAWRPQTPTTAYLELRDDDAFWAAQKVVAFSDDLIRAAVHTGQFSDPAAERYLVSVLMKRRDAIGRAYLTSVNPIVAPRLDTNGILVFGNAAVEAGAAEAPTMYRAVWSRFDNATGGTSLIGETHSTSPTVSAPSGLPGAIGNFVEIDLSADSAAHPSWQQPIRTYFRRLTDGWKLVGLERLPDPPAKTAGPAASEGGR